MKKKFSLFLATLLLLLHSCTTKQNQEEGFIMTVNGAIPKTEMGISLIHEHIFTDFRGVAEFNREDWDKDAAFEAMLPFVEELKKYNVATFVDCTPEFLGRFPLLLKELSQATGINFLVPTGIYGALDYQFMPDYAFTETAEQLAERWLSEWNDGIDETAARPGLIKIGVSRELSELHKKLVVAAAKTHLESGLIIASHTGPAAAAFPQLEILKQEGVSPEAFIWVHAQDAMHEPEMQEKAAAMGAWIGLDGLTADNVGDYVRMISNLKDKGLLHKVLLSHDAGWYDPTLPNGGNIRGYTTIFEKLIPQLRENGFSEEDIHQLVVVNPANAHEIRVRKI